MSRSCKSISTYWKTHTLATHHQDEIRHRRLWQAVILQAFLDISYARYKKAKHSGFRHAAIRWLKPQNHQDEVDLNLVCALADIDRKRVEKGYRRFTKRRQSFLVTYHVPEPDQTSSQPNL